MDNITKELPPVRYEMNQDTYDTIRNLLDTILRGTGMDGFDSVSAVVEGITRVEEKE